MDLRDQFAAAALTGLLASSEKDVSYASDLAFRCADAMIAEREKDSVDSVYSIKQELLKAIENQHGINTDNLTHLTGKHLIRILITGKVYGG